MARRISSVAAPGARRYPSCAAIRSYRICSSLARGPTFGPCAEVFHRNLVYNHILFLHSFIG